MVIQKQLTRQPQSNRVMKLNRVKNKTNVLFNIICHSDGMNQFKKDLENLFHTRMKLNQLTDDVEKKQLISKLDFDDDDKFNSSFSRVELENQVELFHETEVEYNFIINYNLNSSTRFTSLEEQCKNLNLTRDIKFREVDQTIVDSLIEFFLNQSWNSIFNRGLEKHSNNYIHLIKGGIVKTICGITSRHHIEIESIINQDDNEKMIQSIYRELQNQIDSLNKQQQSYMDELNSRSTNDFNIDRIKTEQESDFNEQVEFGEFSPQMTYEKLMNSDYVFSLTDRLNLMIKRIVYLFDSEFHQSTDSIVIPIVKTTINKSHQNVVDMFKRFYQLFTSIKLNPDNDNVDFHFIDSDSTNLTHSIQDSVHQFIGDDFSFVYFVTSDSIEFDLQEIQSEIFEWTLEGHEFNSLINLERSIKPMKSNLSCYLIPSSLITSDQIKFDFIKNQLETKLKRERIQSSIKQMLIENHVVQNIIIVILIIVLIVVVVIIIVVIIVSTVKPKIKQEFV